jgi:transposase
MKNTTRNDVRTMTRRGRTPRQIARKLDLSTQAVYWHINRLRADGELPAETNGGTETKRFSRGTGEGSA